MRVHFLVSTALIGAAALTGCAHDHTHTARSDFVIAEPRDVAPPKITRYADENRDGMVTRDEAKADPALAAIFDRYDLDNNDKLDRGEFARLEDASRHYAASHYQSDSASEERWLSGDDGYFGPERYRYSLNRIGGDQSRERAE